MSKTKVLAFLDHEEGRDVEIIMPLVYYAETYLEASVEFAFVWDVYAIQRVKPALVLLPNAIGSPLYYEISKWSYKNDIPLFALISEGNFRTDGTFNYWGYNKDKLIYQAYVCHWSQRTKDFLTKKLPAYKDKMVLTGALGFDRYSIYQFAQKEELLKKLGKGQYRKVIGYAGWAFGKLFNKQGRQEIQYLHKDNPGRLKWMEDQMYQVESILKKTVENNPDILFLFKRHPNEANPSIVGEGMNEMIRLKDHDNVVYLKEGIPIHDLISASDLWMAFESTTTMESWVMKDSPTLLINPDPDFKRDKLYLGSLIANDYTQLQRYLDEFFKEGDIAAFHSEELVAKRQQLIKDTIGFADGFNHIRAGHYLEKVMPRKQMNSKTIQLPARYRIMYGLMHLGKFVYVKAIFRRLPKFKKTIWIFERFRLKNLTLLKKTYYRYLGDFHAKHKIADKIRSGDILHEIIEVNATIRE